MNHYPNFDKIKVIVIGDVMLDRYYWGNVNRISPEAPVPVVNIHKKTGTPGGAGNVALNLAHLKCRTVLLGVRGNDSPGSFLEQVFQKEVIKTRLIVSDSHPTTTKTRIISHGQQLLRLDEEDTMEISPLIEEQLIRSFEEEIKEAHVVILSDYAKGIFKRDLPQKIIFRCRREGIPVFVDPKSPSWQTYQGATCITPNESEFFAMAPQTSHTTKEIERTAQKTIDVLGLKYLMLTRGSQGISLFQSDSPPVHIPAHAKEVFDVSGAGDTVISTLSASYACGLSIKKAAFIANMAAGIVVGKLGTVPISSEELRKEVLGIQQKRQDKIKSIEDAISIVQSWKENGNRIVFTNGCFDLLHIGHIQLLQAAAQLGDKLIIGLNSDSSVKKLKGELRPITSQNERAAVMGSIDCVDLVTLFSEETPIKLIESFMPDVLVKGGDYTPETVVGKDTVENSGGQVVIIPLIKGTSTTEMIRRIQASCPKKPAQ